MQDLEHVLLQIDLARCLVLQLEVDFQRIGAIISRLLLCRFRPYISQRTLRVVAMCITY